jgi:predicted 3-demethylubiquinone-9 3-methyltransferase (glyoxalase superfamily)
MNIMRKITPHLWFDTQAKAAAAFYAATLPDSRVTHVTMLEGTPSGSVDIVDAELSGLHFQMISAGPLFKFTPAISFMVSCTSVDEVNALWAQLGEGGEVLMPLDAYPHSPRYGWTQDRYGLSWQVMAMPNGMVGQVITPMFMFVNAQCGRAEEAMHFYTALFPNSHIDPITRYDGSEGPDPAGTVKLAGFTLEGQAFMAMDSAYEHDFGFNEAVSLMVHCDTQEEIDYYWERLSADPAAEQCGWLKDKFGVSWQIVPTEMDVMMQNGSPEQVARVTQAFLPMKKFDLAELRRAYVLS